MHLCLHTHTSCAILPAPPAEPKLTEIAGPPPLCFKAGVGYPKKNLEKLLVRLKKGRKTSGTCSGRPALRRASDGTTPGAPPHLSRPVENCGLGTRPRGARPAVPAGEEGTEVSVTSPGRHVGRFGSAPRRALRRRRHFAAAGGARRPLTGGGGGARRVSSQPGGDMRGETGRGAGGGRRRSRGRALSPSPLTSGCSSSSLGLHQCLGGGLRPPGPGPGPRGDGGEALRAGREGPRPG